MRTLVDIIDVLHNKLRRLNAHSLCTVSGNGNRKLDVVSLVLVSDEAYLGSQERKKEREKASANAIWRSLTEDERVLLA